MQQTANNHDISCYNAVEFSDLERHSGLKGEFLHFFGRTVKVWNPQKNCYFYYEKNQLASSLVQNADLTCSQIRNICRKFIEIVHPFDKDALSIEEFKNGYGKFGKAAENYDMTMLNLETQKQQNSPFKQLHYNKNLTEIAGELKVGDIIVRKYHEDNPNLICDLQKFFRKRNFREAYKCSHIAIYLGEKQGKNWVAEASMPHDNEPQIRRLQLDDPRFDLKDKNQYIIIRNSNSDVAKEAARIANLYALKMYPLAEVLPKEHDRDSGFKYSYVEAIRSLWHSNSFDGVAKYRLFKYYSDYINKVPLQNITGKKTFFCSHFVLLSIQMAEAKKSDTFAKMINANKPPISSEHKYSGVAKFFAKVFYVVKRALWSLNMTIKYSRKMDEIIKTKVDFLRTSPQDTVNHLLTANDSYRAVGMINKKASSSSEP